MPPTAEQELPDPLHAVRPMLAAARPAHAGAMAGPPLQLGRISLLGNVYALTFACRDHQPWLGDACSASIIKTLLPAMDREGLTQSLAWTIMPDHVHWLAQLRTGSLGYCAQRFKARSGFLLNRRHGRSGTLWQAGYRDHAVCTSESLAGHALHMLASPVRAGLVTRMEEYPHAWSRWTHEAGEWAGSAVLANAAPRRNTAG